MIATTAPRWRRRLPPWPGSRRRSPTSTPTRRLQEAMIAQAQAELTATAAEITRTKYDVERYRSLAQDQFGLGAALPAGGRRPPEGARRRCQGARGAGGGTAAARRHRHAEAADAGGTGRRDRRSRHRAAQPRLHRTARADRRHGRQSQRADRRLRHGRRAAHLAGAGARALGRCQLQGKPARAHARGNAGDDRGRRAARRSVPRPCRQPGAGDRRACSACCRRRTPPATSPRSCSACRCACCSTATPRRWAGCGPACRSPPPSTSDEHDHGKCLRGTRRTAAGDEGVRLRQHVRRLLHRAAGHPDRLRLAGRHRRRAVRRRRRDWPGCRPAT